MINKWISDQICLLVGFEDDVLIGLVHNLLDTRVLPFVCWGFGYSYCQTVSKWAGTAAYFDQLPIQTSGAICNWVVANAMLGFPLSAWRKRKRSCCKLGYLLFERPTGGHNLFRLQRKPKRHWWRKDWQGVIKKMTVIPGKVVVKLYLVLKCCPQKDWRISPCSRPQPWSIIASEVSPLGCMPLELRLYFIPYSYSESYNFVSYCSASWFSALWHVFIVLIVVVQVRSPSSCFGNRKWSWCVPSPWKESMVQAPALRT